MFQVKLSVYFIYVIMAYFSTFKKIQDGLES